MELEKMATAAAVETRANLYNIAISAFEKNGISAAPIKGGSLLDLGNGYHAKLTISICDPTKVGSYVEAYAEQQAKNAERAAAAAEKAEEKARKAEERAAKKAAKESADAE